MIKLHDVIENLDKGTKLILNDKELSAIRTDLAYKFNTEYTKLVDRLDNEGFILDDKFTDLLSNVSTKARLDYVCKFMKKCGNEMECIPVLYWYFAGAEIGKVYDFEV